MEVLHTGPSRPDYNPDREADHRIGNNLFLISSFVRMKARRQVDRDARDVLLDVAGRIDTVGRLHRLLSESAAPRVPLAKLFSDIRGAMLSIAEEGRLRIRIDCPDWLTVPSDAALHLGLLATELIANAAKYAHPTGLSTHVAIACATDGDELVFSVEDDGVGLPENFDPDASDGLGMTVIRSSVCRLNGRCEWRDLGVGLQFVCRFPAEPASQAGQSAPS